MTLGLRMPHLKGSHKESFKGSEPQNGSSFSVKLGPESLETNGKQNFPVFFKSSNRIFQLVLVPFITFHIVENRNSNKTDGSKSSKLKY